MKRYLIDYLMNARDLGGYKTKRGETLAFQRFIRSDAPQYLSKEGRDFFYEKGIRTVIVLRTIDIAQRFISTYRDDPRFHYVKCPITEGSNAYSKNETESPQTYMKMLEHFDTFYTIMKTFIDTPEGVFYNCSAGKDRTGVVTFLLLDLAGVDRQTILEDYAVSEKHIEERIGLVRSAHPDFPSSMGHSKKEWFLAFFNTFDQTYRSARQYLLRIGLTPYQITKLKHKLTK